MSDFGKNAKKYYVPSIFVREDFNWNEIGSK